MEDVLKRLLDAEVKAEAMVKDAEAEYERVMLATREEIKAAESRYATQIPALHSAALKSAQERATQTIAELKRRYEERQREQHTIAGDRSAEALNAALELLLDSGRS